MPDDSAGMTLTTRPGTLPAAPATAAVLSETALSYARQALSPTTRRAYGSHLRAWEAWCQARNIGPAPAAPALVANHLAELAGKRAYVTLTSRLSTIVQAHALLGLTAPTITTFDALRLRHEPVADCARYDTLRSTNNGMS